jgi:hypothetical protein
MSAEQLAAIAGVLLSLLFSYVPGLSDWYGALDPTKKRLVMAALLLVVAVGVFAASCGQFVAGVVGVTCDKGGALALISAFITALVANQAAYQISPRKLVVAAP